VEAVPGARELTKLAPVAAAGPPGPAAGAPWHLSHHIGNAGSFHSREPVRERAVWSFAVEKPTLALGSAQRRDSVDLVVADALGIDVIHRRSGGGGVLLLPGEFVWIDVVIPAGDPLWDPDVGRSMLWVGEWWRRGLASIGIAGTVHEGGLVASPWSRQVCFSGLGTGEVVDGARKLVGISQRRTREWARFQTMVHLRWRPELVAALVAHPAPQPIDLAALVATVDLAAPAVVTALLAALS
jgi:lipoate-protein ligase A